MTDHRRLHATVKAATTAGTWTAIASAPTLDRDNEVVAGRAFDPLPDRVPVRDGHFGGELVGSGRPYYRGDTLQIDGKFASTPRAQEIRTLVLEGHLDGMSVVFLPIADKDVGGVRHITKAELLAIDFVHIASNRDAAVLAARGLRTAEDPALTLAKARVAIAQAELALMPPEPMTLGKARALVRDTRAFLADLNQRRR